MPPTYKKSKKKKERVVVDLDRAIRRKAAEHKRRRDNFNLVRRLYAIKHREVGKPTAVLPQKLADKTKFPSVDVIRKRSHKDAIFRKYLIQQRQIMRMLEKKERIKRRKQSAMELDRIQAILEAESDTDGYSDSCSDIVDEKCSKSGNELSDSDEEAYNGTPRDEADLDEWFRAAKAYYKKHKRHRPRTQPDSATEQKHIQTGTCPPQEPSGKQTSNKQPYTYPVPAGAYMLPANVNAPGVFGGAHPQLVRAPQTANTPHPQIGTMPQKIVGTNSQMASIPQPMMRANHQVVGMPQPMAGMSTQMTGMSQPTGAYHGANTQCPANAGKQTPVYAKNGVKVQQSVPLKPPPASANPPMQVINVHIVPDYAPDSDMEQSVVETTPNTTCTCACEACETHESNGNKPSPPQKRIPTKKHTRSSTPKPSHTRTRPSRTRSHKHMHKHSPVSEVPSSVLTTPKTSPSSSEDYAYDEDSQVSSSGVSTPSCSSGCYSCCSGTPTTSASTSVYSLGSQTHCLTCACGGLKYPQNQNPSQNDCSHLPTHVQPHTSSNHHSQPGHLAETMNIITKNNTQPHNHSVNSTDKVRITHPPMTLGGRLTQPQLCRQPQGLRPQHEAPEQYETMRVPAHQPLRRRYEAPQYYHPPAQQPQRSVVPHENKPPIPSRHPSLDRNTAADVISQAKQALMRSNESNEMYADLVDEDAYGQKASLTPRHTQQLYNIPSRHSSSHHRRAYSRPRTPPSPACSYDSRYHDHSLRDKPAHRYGRRSNGPSTRRSPPINYRRREDGWNSYFWSKNDTSQRKKTTEGVNHELYAKGYLAGLRAGGKVLAKRKTASKPKKKRRGKRAKKKAAKKKKTKTKQSANQDGRSGNLYSEPNVSSNSNLQMSVHVPSTLVSSQQ